jgi:hypothetical protein
LIAGLLTIDRRESKKNNGQWSIVNGQKNNRQSSIVNGQKTNGQWSIVNGQKTNPQSSKQQSSIVKKPIANLTTPETQMRTDPLHRQ